MTSLYKIAEQISFELGGGHDLQAIIAFVIDSYSSLVRLEFFQNKQDGTNEVQGQYIYLFGKSTPLTPIKDTVTDEYYIELPSSTLSLPHEMGIVRVSDLKCDDEFIRVNRLWNKHLKANQGWGKQVYIPEETRICFPKMKDSNTCDIKLALAVALDNVDVDQELNIPRSIIEGITLSVASRFKPQPTQVKAN
jgi:hypothetical protein